MVTQFHLTVVSLQKADPRVPAGMLKIWQGRNANSPTGVHRAEPGHKQLGAICVGASGQATSDKQAGED